MLSLRDEDRSFPGTLPGTAYLTSPEGMQILAGWVGRTKGRRPSASVCGLKYSLPCAVCRVESVVNSGHQIDHAASRCS